MTHAMGDRSVNGDRTLNERITALEVAVATLGATLSTKLDSLIAATSATTNDHETRIRALEARPAPDPALSDRVTKLEKARYIVTGAALLAGGSAGTIANFFGGG